MPDLYAALLALVLVAAVVLTHFQALRLMSEWQNRLPWPRHLKVLGIIFGLIFAHALEAFLFSLGYSAGSGWMGLGDFMGQPNPTLAQMFYFSIETYTTQGVGDLYLVGALRLVASIEPLVGLILIGWSTSFTFLIMGLDWRLGGPDRS